MLTKLPDWLVTRWSRIVVQYKVEYRQFPPFKNFVEFISQEAKIASDPVTSLQSVKGDFIPSHINNNGDRHRAPERRHERQPNTRTFQGRALLTDTSDKSTTDMSRTASKLKEKVKCLYCDLWNHDLDACRTFRAKAIETRKDFAKNNQLCFGCLGSGHVSKRCTQRKICEICEKRHPTSLHGDLIKHNAMNSNTSAGNSSVDNVTTKPESFQSGTVHMSSIESSAKSSMIIPVYVSHLDFPNDEVLVYALLDTQSDTTFILSETCNKLGLTGTEVKLSLSTMFAENQVVDSRKVKGLVVRGYGSPLRIPLPTAFTPANRSHIPTPEMARNWHHLHGIADELLPLQNCDIGLLIGYNCSRALIPREVIPATKDGPYGQRTDLGWGIVGCVNSTRNDEDQIRLDTLTECRRSKYRRNYPTPTNVLKCQYDQR